MMPHPANSAAHGEVDRLRNTRRPRTQALVVYATTSTGMAANNRAMPSGMPTSVTSARTASSGKPIAIATPHPTVTPRLAHRPLSGVERGRRNEDKQRADDQRRHRHREPPAEQAHPTPAVRGICPVLVADLAVDPGAAREHRPLVAVAQVTADTRRRTEDGPVGNGDQVTIDSAAHPHRPTNGYDVACDVSSDCDRAIDHDHVARSLALRHNRPTCDDYMVRCGRGTAGSDQESQHRDNHCADYLVDGHRTLLGRGPISIAPARRPPQEATAVDGTPPGLESASRDDGRCPARTGDLLLVRQALYQLS